MPKERGRGEDKEWGRGISGQHAASLSITSQPIVSPTPPLLVSPSLPLMQLNLSTRELDRTRIKLRDDVIVRPVPTADGVSYQLEDPVAVRFYRVGRAEYVLISLLDGRTSLAEAVTVSSRALGHEAFSEQEATSVCLWLVETGLATPTEGSFESMTTKTASLSSLFNPFWMKLPLLRPERLLDRLLPWTRWFFTGPAILAIVALWVAAGVVLAGHSEEFWSDSRQVFSSNNWLMLAIVWVVLKVLHEFGHGLACRYHGGRVTEMGVVFVLFAPMAYVDVTSSWGFRSRWKRMHVAAGGILVELTVAALAALCWTQATTPFARHLLHNIVVSASLTTLVFNINPLMRFDGYFILEDLLDLPNLGTTASRWLQSRLARFFYGEQRNVPVPTGLSGHVIRSYALLSSIWRLTVSASLLAGAAVMFRGAGLAIAIGAMLLWYVKPVFELLGSLVTRWRRDEWSATRAVLLGSLTAALVGALVFLLPSPFQRRAPGVVDYADLEVVRVSSAGFVEDIRVVNGQTVEAGDELVLLHNEELDARVTDLELAIEQSEAKRIGQVNRKELALAQIELRNQQALREQLTEARLRTEALTVKAPVAGRVLARRLDQQLGNYLKEGTELLVIGDDTRKEVLASIDQRDLEAFSVVHSDSADLRIRGTGPTVSASLALEPRASTRLPHPALSAVHGGEVDVVASASDTDNEDVKLSEPRFLLRAKLDAAASSTVFAGQHASAAPLSGRRTIAQQLTTSLRDWARSLIDPR